MMETNSINKILDKVYDLWMSEGYNWRVNSDENPLKVWAFYLKSDKDRTIQPGIKLPALCINVKGLNLIFYRVSNYLYNENWVRIADDYHYPKVYYDYCISTPLYYKFIKQYDIFQDKVAWEDNQKKKLDFDRDIEEFLKS